MPRLTVVVEDLRPGDLDTGVNLTVRATVPDSVEGSSGPIALTVVHYEGGKAKAVRNGTRRVVVRA